MPGRRLLSVGEWRLYGAGELRAADADGARAWPGGSEFLCLAYFLVQFVGRAGGRLACAPRGGGGRPMTISASLLAMLAALALPIAEVAWAPALGLLHGFCYALPITVFSALAAEAVAPERRARGLGVYFVWFYAGCTGCPAFAGWLRDVTGSATAPVFFAVAALGVGLGLYVWFRRDLARG